MILFHGSDIGGIEELRPSDGKLFLTTNKILTIPYQVNPLKVFAKKNDIPLCKVNSRFAWYSTNDGKFLGLKDYFPDMAKYIYSGQKAYIYEVDVDENTLIKGSKEGEYISTCPIKVKNVEIIEDVYENIIKLQNEGKVKIFAFNNLSLNWNINFEVIYLQRLNYKDSVYIKFVEQKIGLNIDNVSTEAKKKFQEIFGNQKEKDK